MTRSLYVIARKTLELLCLLISTIQRLPRITPKSQDKKARKFSVFLSWFFRDFNQETAKVCRWGHFWLAPFSPFSLFPYSFLPSV